MKGGALLNRRKGDEIKMCEGNLRPQTERENAD